MAFGLAETAKLAVDLSLKGNFASSLGASQRALGGFDKAITNTQGRAYKAGTQIGVGIQRGALIAAGAIGFLGSQVIAGLGVLSKLEGVSKQTGAVLKSTGGIAGLTADDIRKLAEKYEGLNALIDDKVIQSGENVLLTFTKIHKDAFEPALLATLNLNTAMGGNEESLQANLVKVGRALSDPAKNLQALTRAGVVFTDKQKAQILALQKSGDLLGAQKLIIAELGTEFGGSFATQGATAKGAIAGIGDAVEDLQAALATGLFPVIQKVLPKIRAALADPKVLDAIKGIGDKIAGLFTDENIAEGGKILGTLFDTAKAAAPVVGEAAKATLAAVQAAVGLFRSLPPEVQKLAIGAFAINKITGGLVTNIAGGLISSVLKQLVSGVVNVNGAVVNVNGAAGIPGAGGGGKGGGLLGTAAKIIVPVAIASIAAEAALAISGVNDPSHRLPNGSIFRGTTDPVQNKVNQDAAIAALTERAAKGDTFAQKQLDAILKVRDAVNQAAASQSQDVDKAASVEAAREAAAARRDSAILGSSKTLDSHTRSGLAGVLAQTRASTGKEVSASNAVKAAVDRAKAATQAAAQRVAAEVRDKDLSVRTSVTAVFNNYVKVSNKQTSATQTTKKLISGWIES